MGIMTIDGQAIEFTDEPNVLSVIRKAERRNDYLYKYTKADALPETDTGTTSGCSLQRLYDMYQERRVSSAGTGAPYGSS